jgi:hypothetical protein
MACYRDSFTFLPAIKIKGRKIVFTLLFQISMLKESILNMVGAGNGGRGGA